MALYFAYGSNLSTADWQRWCAEHGHEPHGLSYLRPARLEGWALEFSIRSRRRGGGVLNMRECAGAVVCGGLFEVDAQGWRALDAKEGVPTTYERRGVTVQCSQGLRLEVQTYVAAPGVAARLVRPADPYVALVRQALLDLQIDAQGLETAAALGYTLGE